MTSHAIKQFLSVAFSIKRAVGLKRSVTFRHLVLLQAPAMPTTWYYISGCPFPAECTRYKTTASKKKSLVFSGLTKEDAVEKCANHLMLSSLHKKGSSEAYRVACEQEMYEHDEPTDEEDQAEERPWKSRRLDPSPSSSSRGGPRTGRPRTGRPRSPFTPPREAAEPDPLVTDISTRVAALVEDQLSTRASASSSSGSPTIREAMMFIADAEEGVRKAQKIALSAAQAFGEVSSKLKESYHKLAFIATQGGFFGSGPS